MVKNLIEKHDVGVDFYVYLKGTDRHTISERGALRTIYEEEFKSSGRYGFGNVLFGLSFFGKIKVINGQWIVYTKKFQQWLERTDMRPQAYQMMITEPNSPELIADKIKIFSTEHRFESDGKMSLSVVINTEHTVPLYISNTGTKTVFFTGYRPLYQSSNISLDVCRVTQRKPVALQTDRKYEVCTVKFRAGEVGVLSVKLSFEFRLERSSTYFHIERVIEAQCITALGKELAPTAPYRPCPIIARTPPSKFIIEFGQPPQGFRKMRPLDYKLLGPAPTGSDERKRILEASLSWENYAQKFRLLLEMELYQMEVDLKKCNIPNGEQEEAKMKKDRSNKELLILKVPDVNRVSLLRGDCLLVYPVQDTTKKYCVYVDSVHQDTVKVGYNKELMGIFVEGMSFHVEFVPNSLNIGIQCRAARFAVETGLSPVLFPAAPLSSVPQRALPDLKLCDRKLEGNPEQCRAVQHIVAGSSKPAPYLLFGPPGTGKTVTVAEAIKQIVRSQPESHVLACAPTNSAADQLCENILMHVPQSTVLRIYAKYMKPSDIQLQLKGCSNLNEEGIFDFPKDFKEKLMKYKVIVTTLFTSSRIVTAKVPTGHFTHVFVDEAGHAMETECLLPLAGLLNPKTGQVVLAGDPKQLGPIVKSQFALKFGLGLSLLERLMTDCPLYKKTNNVFDDRFVTKLLHNYRSHPAILEVPNELFYNRELKASADEYKRNLYCNWEYLPQKGFPIIFHEVTSLEFRESSCPSFFNISEVEVLIDYVKKLLETQGKKGHSNLSPQEIGIITPYGKQVQKIRLALQKMEDSKLKDISSIKVGSVEEFQGQEKRVILVSTVRSSPGYAEFDKTFKLGFLKNKKRFNVAVTRAKALLIIVGNPLVLRLDPTWARYIDYCKDRGGYRTHHVSSL